MSILRSSRAKAEPAEPAPAPQPSPADGGGPPEPTSQPSPARREPIGPVPAILRHPILALLIVLACTGAGVAAGLQRTPVYSAESRLSVGNIDVESQALPGYVTAVQSLAASYSRAIDSQQVIEPVAREAGLAPTEVARRVSASPIPGSSVMRVSATGSGEQEAVELANVTTRSLLAYVKGLDSSDSSSRSLLRAYRRAELDVSEARRVEARRREAFDTSANRERAERLREAEADVRAASLRARSLAQQYQDSLQNRPPSNFIQVLSEATTAVSDQRSELQLRAFTGLVGGLVLAAALLTALANRRRRRA